MIKSVLLVPKDGTQSHGRAIGATGSVVGEVVSNTPMTGYREILTDPSYSRQIVTPTYPHIDNVGTNDTDEEPSQVHAQGLVIRDLPLIASNFRNTENLSSCLKRHNIAVIADIDTRKLTRSLREKGAQNGCIIADDNPDVVLALEEARAFPGPNGMDLVKEVTTAEPYSWTQRSQTLTGDLPEAEKEDELLYHAVAYDSGARRNILRMLVDRGCRLIVIPAQISVEDVLKMNPDGIFLSNGPGDLAPYDCAVTAIQKFLETNTPVFGICLGHRLLALANGAKTVKMKFGHHGGNHPVKDVEKNVVMIIAQDYGFAVDEATLLVNLRVTHRLLFDGMLQGIRHADKPMFSFQGRPEAGPDPHDAVPLLDYFIALVEQYHKTTK